MDYTINIIERNGRRIPEVVFADPRLATASEMLLTERGFLEPIIGTLNDAVLGNRRCEMSFNTFSVEAEPELTLIRDDYTYRKVTVETKPFLEVVRAYCDVLCKIRSGEDAPMLSETQTDSEFEE